MEELTSVSSPSLTNKISSFPTCVFLKTHVAYIFVALIGQYNGLSVFLCAAAQPPLRLFLPRGMSHALFIFESPNPT